MQLKSFLRHATTKIIPSLLNLLTALLFFERITQHSQKSCFLVRTPVTDTHTCNLSEHYHKQCENHKNGYYEGGHERRKSLNLHSP